MNSRPIAFLLSLVGAYACSGIAYAAASDSQTAAPSIAGWNELLADLQDLPGRLLSKLPASMQNDPQVQQEIGRRVLAALASASIDAIGSDGDHPEFLPQIGQLLNVGQPNADTVYRVARITPGGVYRLRGERGSLRMADISQSGAMPHEPGGGQASPRQARRSHDINALRVDAQGRFDVVMSVRRPAGHTGDWWALEPSTTRLLLRMVSADWIREQDPTISIERVDKPMGRERRSAADLEQRLRHLPAATNFIATLFVDHVEKLRREGFVNKLKVFDPTGALAGQFYYEGAYELRDDEALILETTVPKRCAYRSMILTNELYETTDWYNNHSSLNDAQARPDSDGVLRIVVSAQDPGTPNWLDTAGHPTGVIQGRWYQCDSRPVPSIRKIALADVRESLPQDTKILTSSEREQIVRERRAAYQQRPLW